MAHEDPGFRKFKSFLPLLGRSVPEVQEAIGLPDTTVSSSSGAIFWYFGVDTDAFKGPDRHPSEPDPKFGLAFGSSVPIHDGYVHVVAIFQHGSDDKKSLSLKAVELVYPMADLNGPIQKDEVGVIDVALRSSWPISLGEITVALRLENEGKEVVLEDNLPSYTTTAIKERNSLWSLPESNESQTWRAPFLACIENRSADLSFDIVTYIRKADCLSTATALNANTGLYQRDRQTAELSRKQFLASPVGLITVQKTESGAASPQTNLVWESWAHSPLEVACINAHTVRAFGNMSKPLVLRIKG